MTFRFSDGSSNFMIQCSASGPQLSGGSTTLHHSFTPGKLIVENIYDVFRDHDITLPKTLQLVEVSFLQQICPDPEARPQSLRMVVDAVWAMAKSTQSHRMQLHDLGKFSENVIWVTDFFYPSVHRSHTKLDVATFHTPDGEIMFYDFIKSKLEAGDIRVRTSTRDSDGKIYSDARGIAAIAMFFLSRKERQQIADLSKYIALRRCEVRYGDEDY